MTSGGVKTGALGRARLCGGGAVGRLQRGSHVSLSILDTSKTLSGLGLVGRLCWSVGALSLKGKGLSRGTGEPIKLREGR
jgi:hypothetical protein